MGLKIPYATSKLSSKKPASIKNFLQNREQQMKYTRASAVAGVYRTWITQLTEEELKRFIVQNMNNLERKLEYKTFGPSLDWELIHRNELYTLELIYRENNGEIDEVQLEAWAGDCESDREYWQGKYEVAVSLFQTGKNKVEPQETASKHTPYY